jgi:hypothetical protein
MQSLLPSTCLLQDLAASSYPNPMLSINYPKHSDTSKSYHSVQTPKCAIQFLLNAQMERSPSRPILFTDNKNDNRTLSISKQVSRRISKGTTATFDNAFTIAHFHVPIKKDKVEKDLLGKKRTRPPSPEAYQFVILPPSS